MGVYDKLFQNSYPGSLSPGFITKGMEYQLRDYQKAASDAAINFFSNQRSKKNGIIVLPTGSGKSLVIADIANRLGGPVLIFQPSKEILEQNFNKMIGYTALGVSIFSASAGRKDISKITFATIGSVMGRINDFRIFRHVIIDECHLVNSQEGMYHDFIEATGCKVLGLTATPYRLHTDALGSVLKFLTRTRPRIFHEVIYNVQVKDLKDRGYLADLQYFNLKVIDRSKLALNSTGNDYTDISLRRYYRESNFNDSLEGYVRRLLAKRKSILVFTRFVEEAQNLVQVFGDKAAVVAATMRKKERERILKDFKAGIINVVANVGVLTTGFDYPELDTVVIARPTMSLALWYQMVGRAIRPCNGKLGWIVDLGGNYERFGKVEDLVMKPAPDTGLWAIFTGGRQLTNVYTNRT